MVEGVDAARATGPDDVNFDPQWIPQHLAHDSKRDNASQCDLDSRISNNCNRRNDLKNASVYDGRRRNEGQNEKAPCRTRTGDLQFTKPLFYQLS